MRGDVNNMSAENRAYPRLLFCSYHCYPDPSSGAALATRDLLELLAARGWACGVLSGPRLDAEAVPRLEQLLHDHGLSFEAHAAPGGATSGSTTCRFAACPLLSTNRRRRVIAPFPSVREPTTSCASWTA